MPVIKDIALNELTTSGLFEFSSNSAFDALHSPGGNSKVLYAGIYRCTACDHEIGIARDHEFPPCSNSKKHDDRPLVHPEWQLVAAASEARSPR